MVKGFLKILACGALLGLGSAAARPASAYLNGLTHVSQTYNNCGPAALVSVLGYYGVQADQAAVARVLRPSGGYMRADVIAPFVGQYGLRAERFRAGNAEHLRRLVAAGVPVIVLQWLDRVGGIPHFRVVRGYDDKQGVFYLDDPLFGANVYVKYADFSRLWGVYGQEFIPVYPKGWDGRVNALLGFDS